MPHLVGDLLRNEITASHIRPHNLDVDGRWQTEVQNLRNDICGLEEELHSRKTLRQNLAQMADVPCRGMMMLGIESDQDLSVTGADGAIGTVGLINPGVRQTDVVEHRLQFTLWDLLAQHGLDFIAEPCCLFDAQARTPAYMQAQLARIHLREEVLAQEHEHPEREHAEDQETSHEDTTMLKS